MSSKGLRHLVVAGYSFICRTYCTKSVKKVWKCATHSGCTAKAHTIDDEIVQIHNFHDHPPRCICRAVYMTQNGRNVLMVGQNRFMKHYECRQGRTRWRCCKSFMRCRAIAITRGNHLVKLKDIHNHPAPDKPARKLLKTEIPYEEYFALNMVTASIDDAKQE